MVAEVAGVASVDQPRGCRYRLAPCAPRANSTAFRHRQHRDGQLVRGNDARLQDSRPVGIMRARAAATDRPVPAMARGSRTHPPQRSAVRMRASRRRTPRSNPTLDSKPCSRSSVRASLGSIPTDWFEGSAPVGHRNGQLGFDLRPKHRQQYKTVYIAREWRRALGASGPDTVEVPRRDAHRGTVVGLAVEGASAAASEPGQTEIRLASRRSDGQAEMGG